MSRITWKPFGPERPLYYKMSARGITVNNSGLPVLDTYRESIDKWMIEYNCGQWVHRYMVKFDTDEQVTLFLLRWA